MALNLAKAVLGYLKERPDEKLTARQIAEWVFAILPEQCQAKKQSSQYLTTSVAASRNERWATDKMRVWVYK